MKLNYYLKKTQINILMNINYISLNIIFFKKNLYILFLINNNIRYRSTNIFLSFKKLRYLRGKKFIVASTIGKEKAILTYPIVKWFRLEIAYLKWKKYQ